MRQVDKDIINTNLHDKVRSLGRVGASDYTGSRANIQVILDDIAVEGWIPVSSGWETDTKIEIRRVWVERITRTAEHQTAAEAAGEVAIGENTYEQVRTEIIVGAVGEEVDLGDEQAGQGNIVIVDENLAMMGVLALSSSAKPERPANRLRDL